MTTQVATIGNVGGTREARRPSLEELVDRLIAAMFPQEEETTETVARSVHDARRLRQTGDLDGALAVFAGADTWTLRRSRAVNSWAAVLGWFPDLPSGRGRRPLHGVHPLAPWFPSGTRRC